MYQTSDEKLAALKAAQWLQEYCYTQDECDDCIFYMDFDCTLFSEPMEWTDYFPQWSQKVQESKQKTHDFNC